MNNDPRDPPNFTNQQSTTKNNAYTAQQMMPQYLSLPGITDLNAEIMYLRGNGYTFGKNIEQQMHEEY